MKKICIIVASEGKNLELANKIKDYLVTQGAETSILNIVALDLPLYSARSDAKFSAVDLVAPVKSQLDSQSFFFVAPEYNGSTPPTFNNFIAWVSRASKDWRISFNNKTAAIACHSGGGGLHALLHMRVQLSFIGMNVLGRQILAHSQKPLDDASLTAVCNELLRNTFDT